MFAGIRCCSHLKPIEVVLVEQSFSQPLPRLHGLVRELARITHDLSTVVNVGESCASPLRRSTWLDACLVPGVPTAFDYLNSPKGCKINSTCRVPGSI